uniref:G-protein coupled receptors family 1 profile domain-containing protein n=1 Tax=Scylla olivacea TaxID=85551 RepID=A0A0P4WG30_SCYOL
MISFDRYNIICNGFNGPKMTNGKAIFLAIISWAISIGFAIAPLFGWGKYTLEGILDSCSYDYLTQDFNTRSYNIVIFVVDYFLPAAITISYACIVKAIFAHEAAMRAQAKKMNVTTLRTGVSLPSLELSDQYSYNTQSSLNDRCRPCLHRDLIQKKFPS